MSTQKTLLPPLRVRVSLLLFIIWLASISPATKADDDVLAPPAIDQVKIGGEIGRRIDVTIANNFNKLDLEGDFIKPFRVKDRDGGFIGTGMLMDGAVGLAAYSGDAEALRRKNLLVAETLKLQEADGYIGVSKPESRIWKLWDVHEMSYFMEGWLRDYRLFHNRQALDAACKTADYVVDRWGADPNREIDGQINTVIGTTGIEPILLDLYRETGNKKYLDFTVNVRKLPEWNHEIVLGRWHDIRGHAFGHMSRCLAQLKLYRLQPDEKLLQGSLDVVDFLTRGDGLVVSGACGDHECWHNTQEGTVNLGETCASAYLLRLLNELALIQGHSCYGDIMERIVFNTLFAAQSPEGRQIRYYTPFDGGRSYFEGDMWCCPNNYRRIISEIPKMIYYRRAGGAVVNLYTASSAKLELPSGVALSIRQETDYPSSGKITFQVDPASPAEFPLWLRIPAWCADATVKVNGSSLSVADGKTPACAGEYLEISRVWQSGDIVELDMPMPLRLVKGRVRQAGSVAVMRGPLLFCLDPAKNQSLENFDLRLLVIDPTTFSGPIQDGSVRPGGLAYRVKAWPPGAWYPQVPPTLDLLLTEFTDPGGRATYFKTPNPDEETFSDDELTKVKVK